VDVEWDGKLVQTIPVEMGPGGSAVLGSTFELGATVLGAPTGLRTARKRLVGSGYRLALAVRNALAGQDFSIAKLLVSCVLGDERTRRA
jgi:hypothetical protein